MSKTRFILICLLVIVGGFAAARYFTPAGSQLSKQAKQVPNAEREQERVQFGAPVRAVIEEPTASAAIKTEIIPLSQSAPDAGLANGAEIHWVSGYEPINRSVPVSVHVDRPGVKVMLLLTSYHKVDWIVTASTNTRIEAILVGGYEQPSTLRSIENVRAFAVRWLYSTEISNINFVKTLEQLNQVFGRKKIDSFHGSYEIPRTVAVTKIDKDNEELTLEGPKPKNTSVIMNFNFLSTTSKFVPWTLSGPVDKLEYAYPKEGKRAVNPLDSTIYSLKNDHLEVQQHGKSEIFIPPLPANFPKFSWANDLAFDSERKIVAVVTSGGEGFFYRFDTIQGKWIDYRSLNNVDLESLTYDDVNQRYVGWSSDGNLIFISVDGSALFSKNVLSRMNGFGRLYDSGNGRPPRVQLVAKGNDIVIAAMTESVVGLLWHFDLKADLVRLTYTRAVADSAR